MKELDKGAALLAAIAVACGAKTTLEDPEGTPRAGGDDAGFFGSGGGDGASSGPARRSRRRPPPPAGGTGGAIASGGTVSAGGTGGFVGPGGSVATGGVATGGVAMGGFPATGGAIGVGGAAGVPATGGFAGAGGFTGSGGVSAGGFGGAPADLQRIEPYLCWASCTGARDCPSALPYAGGCNAVTQGCTITCEAGCPPETQELRVAGGCACYGSGFGELTGPGRTRCCSTRTCGSRPYYLPCCEGMSCIEGQCLNTLR